MRIAHGSHNMKFIIFLVTVYTLSPHV
jgi:hypothetical protein